jgi:hypothetical protein
LPLLAASSTAAKARAVWSASNSARSIASRVRGGKHRPHPRLGARAGCAEQLDVLAALHQRVAEQRQHLLDAAVARRRHGNPGRCQHGDPEDSLDWLALGGRTVRRLRHHVVAAPVHLGGWLRHVCSGDGLWGLSVMPMSSRQTPGQPWKRPVKVRSAGLRSRRSGDDGPRLPLQDPLRPRRYRERPSAPRATDTAGCQRSLEGLRTWQGVVAPGHARRSSETLSSNFCEDNDQGCRGPSSGVG